MYQQKIVPKIIDHKERNKECHIKTNWKHSRKNNLSNLLVASIYSIAQFKIMKLVKAVKSLSLRKKNRVIREFDCSKILKFIFLIFFPEGSAFRQSYWDVRKQKINCFSATEKYT